MATKKPAVDAAATTTSTTLAPGKKAKTPLELKAIFDAVKPLLTPYEKGSMKVRVNFETKYDLWSEMKLVDQKGKPRDEMAFLAMIVQSSYMGFYFMPVYTHPDLVEKLGPNLRACLKGKSCFHLTRWDAELEQEVKAALKLGYALYKEVGWVK
jgi:hypothetical protein